MNLNDGQPKPQVSTPRRDRTRWPWRFILLLAVLAGGIAVMGQMRNGGGGGRVAWRHSYDQAVAESNETARPLLMFFTADWCPPCTQMKAWVFSDHGVAQTIEAGFIPVRVDLSREGLPDQFLADRYGVQAIPTILILTPDGRTISMSAGYLSKSELLTWLENAGDRYAAIRAQEAESSRTVYVQDGRAD